MNKKKYIIAGGILILLIGGILIVKKATAKPTPPVKKRTGSIEVGEVDKGTFATPAEVKTKQDTRLRADSNTNSKIIFTYNKGVQLFVTSDKKEKDGTWYRVNDAQGRVGWVREDVVDIQLPTDNPFVDEINKQLADWELYNV